MDIRSSISDAEGRDWIASLRDRWRLQIMSRRMKRRSDGTSSEIPARIRRFVEGLPWAHVKPAIDALLAAAPYSGVIANGVDFGTAYRPTLTVWQRDAQSAALGAVRPDATYTLIQDLVEDTDRDVYGVGSSSSCSEEVVADYVWDAPGVEDLPEGGQGVTYSIAAVHRNDDGTFDYQVVKRVAKTQHVEPVTVRDDATTRVTQELWDNVYTNAAGEYVDETGARLDIPAAGVEDGVSTRIEGLSENPDCTLKFQVVREESKPAETRETCRKTVFEHEHGTVVAGEASMPDHVPEAGGGRYEEVDGQLQPDGSYTVTAKTTDEKRQVSGKDYRRTTRALVTTTVTRNTAERASPPSKPGRESHEMTPGGLYNLTVTDAKPNAVPDSARCAATVFEETDDKVSMSGSLSNAHFKPGSGKHGEIVQDMDEYGVVKKVVRTTTEKEQVSGKEYRRTPRAAITTTTTRNTPTKAKMPSKPGRESHEMTPGGRYNLVVTDVKASPTPDSARCAATVFEHVHDSVSMSTVLSPNAEASAGGGMHSEIVQDMDEYGVVKKVVRTTTEREQASGKDYRRTTRALVTTTVTRNTPLTAAVPARPGGRQSHEMTPGGRYNLTVVEATPSPVPDSARCSATIFEHVHDYVSMQASIVEAEAAAGGGSYQEIVQDMDEYGVVKRVARTTREKPVSNALVERSVHLEGVVRKTVNRNMPSSAALPGSTEIGKTVTNEQMPGGSITQTIVEADPAPVGKIGSGCEQNHAVHTHSTTEGRGTDPGPEEAEVPSLEDGQIHSVRLEKTQFGAWRRTEENRTAKPLVGVTTWMDTVVSPTRKQTYSNKFVCFRNYTEHDVQSLVNGFGGNGQTTVHHSRNDYGLLDGSVHYKELLSDEENPSGRGNGPGEQGDKHKDVTTYLRRKNGRYVERLEFRAHRRILWSTAVNMLAEVNRGESRPDLGWVSAIHGWYAIIYTDIRSVGDWEKE